MTATKRVRLSPEARRAQLIALGVDMLATRRLDELSVEEIASQAGISRGLLFHYFTSKQDFHREVARAAAAEMIRRTAPDTSLPPAEVLRSSLAAFVDYVEENPDNYTSLVRGAATGDEEMRAIFTDTREVMAQRVLAVVRDLGVELSPAADLAVHGWVAYVEECVIRWTEARTLDREDLLRLLADALPAVVVAAADRDAAALLTLLRGED